MNYRYGFHLSNYSFKETDTLASVDTMQKEPKELTIRLDGVQEIHLDQETVQTLLEDQIHTGG